MNNNLIKQLFHLLDEKNSDLKILKYNKEESKNIFLERIQNATDNIHLFGLNFPNFFTTVNDKILQTLKELDKKNLPIEVFIYIPSIQIRDKITTLNIYEADLSPEKIRINVDMISSNLQEKFNNIKINVTEYTKLYKIGISAVDLGTENAFLHLSQVKENELIKNAEYFNIEYSETATPLLNMVKGLLEKIKNEN